MSRSQSNIVVSYHDCILRKEDIHLLEGPHWLNDAVIGFYFEYLGQKYRYSRLLFVSPELTQLLKLTDSSEYSVFLQPLEATYKDYLFFPLNDCSSRLSSGGSHWSLLVFSRSDKTCFHFDSSKGMNGMVARAFSRDISNYLLDRTGQYVEIDCPHQENGYDCGLFVLCFAEVIAECIQKRYKIEECKYDSVRRLVSEKRRSLLNLINTLKITH
ncbi:sentrin-specific protease 8-like [Trichogramma pretiosum]|uniref:sentrin-specific protease 8-like n=1 Tax=Trichogramma pretiosum TaxID=7493 RepID=UPI0006C942E0|nr:sentrin-specific protease 8-like [Trichogramma pretiosum]